MAWGFFYALTSQAVPLPQYICCEKEEEEEEEEEEGLEIISANYCMYFKKPQQFFWAD